jgi:hypothetical protein
VSLVAAAGASLFGRLVASELLAETSQTATANSDAKTSSKLIDFVSLTLEPPF